MLEHLLILEFKLKYFAIFIHTVSPKNSRYGMWCLTLSLYRRIYYLATLTTSICFRACPPGSVLKKTDATLRKCVGAQTQTDSSIVEVVLCDKRATEENVDEGYEGEDEKVTNQ